MPAAGLLDIKRRIKSVNNTRKITRAMALVSTAKLRKAKVNLINNNKYFDRLDEAKDKVFNLADDAVDNVFITGNKSEKKLFVVFTSNSGLCGSFNGSSLAYLHEKYAKENAKVLIIGERGIPYAKKYGFNIFDTFKDIKEEMSIKQARLLCVEILSSYINEDFGEIRFVYVKYVSSMVQEVHEEKILPFDGHKEKEEDESENIFSTDVDAETLVGNFLYRYIEAKLINCAFNSKASEENFRMQAMDGATKNADDILEKLTSKYNRIRQNAITQEISEIVGGVTAQNQ